MTTNFEKDNAIQMPLERAEALAFKPDNALEKEIWWAGHDAASTSKSLTELGSILASARADGQSVEGVYLSDEVKAVLDSFSDASHKVNDVIARLYRQTRETVGDDLFRSYIEEAKPFLPKTPVIKVMGELSVGGQIINATATESFDSLGSAVSTFKEIETRANAKLAESQ